MIKVQNIISAIDYHAAGMPVRIVQGGVPPIPGKTMQEKHEYAKKHLEWLRTALMYEPRGHKAQFGLILTEPCREDCDIGTLMMSYHNYLEMCGHGMIGLGTMLTDTNMTISQIALKLGFSSPDHIAKYFRKHKGVNPSDYRKHHAECRHT